MRRQSRMPPIHLRTALLSAALLAAHAIVKADALPRHHRADGFQNNYIEFEPKGLGALLKWKLESSREGLPKPPAVPTPQVAADLDFIRDNARAGAAMQPTLTWIGHASTLVQLGGLNLLTDPVFSERASPLSFMGP